MSCVNGIISFKHHNKILITDFQYWRPTSNQFYKQQAMFM
uniref:Uncharacterized protein n=1 Tax=Anguilla anguilla TaxID=7936 RepID=A0A0E9WBU4_ANGAN